MSKPIYKPQPMYKSNINDMVEDLVKGGPGSGKRGHKTFSGRTSMDGLVSDKTKQAMSQTSGQPNKNKKKSINEMSDMEGHLMTYTDKDSAMEHAKKDGKADVYHHPHTDTYHVVTDGKGRRSMRDYGHAISVHKTKIG